MTLRPSSILRSMEVPRGSSRLSHCLSRSKSLCDKGRQPFGDISYVHEAHASANTSNGLCESRQTSIIST